MKNLTVYTVLVGAKESLNNPLSKITEIEASDLNINYVCITDNINLRSDVWDIKVITSGHVPPEKLSRRAKAMPHEYFPDTEFSLYIDNTVNFKRLPHSADITTSRPYLFRAFRHATRSSPTDEAAAVATIGYDDISVICEQIDFYGRTTNLGAMTSLTTGTMLLRSHNCQSVKSFGIIWWESILAFSKRDQISIDFSLYLSGCEVEYFSGSSHENDMFLWDGEAKHRVHANFDERRYSWINRADTEAVKNPREHYLTSGIRDDNYNRPSELLDYACYMVGSSLGSRVSPRRCMASPIQHLVKQYVPEGSRSLIVGITESSAERRFEPNELTSAKLALTSFFKFVNIDYSIIDLSTSSLIYDGVVFQSTDNPYHFLIALGLDSVRLNTAVEKFIRLMDLDAGTIIIALTEPTKLEDIATAKNIVEQYINRSCHASIVSSRHDDFIGIHENTLVSFSWSLNWPV